MKERLPIRKIFFKRMEQLETYVTYSESMSTFIYLQIYTRDEALNQGGWCVPKFHFGLFQPNFRCFFFGLCGILLFCHTLLTLFFKVEHFWEVWVTNNHRTVISIAWILHAGRINSGQKYGFKSLAQILWQKEVISQSNYESDLRCFLT